MAQDIFDLSDEEEIKGDRPPPPASAWHHVVVMEADNSRVGKKGGHVNGPRFHFESRASTAPNQFGREFEIVIFGGDPSHRDGGKFADSLQRRLMTKLLEAVGYTNKSQRGQKGVAIDWDKLPGLQCVVLIDVDTAGEFPRVEFVWKTTDENPELGIYAIDDPLVKHVPLDPEALALSPPEQRARAMALRGKGAPATKSPAAAAAASQPAPAPAAATNMAANDLFNV